LIYLLIFVVVVVYLVRPYDEAEKMMIEHRAKLEEDTRLL